MLTAKNKWSFLPPGLRLPLGDQAEIASAKINDYLLSDKTPASRGKKKFLVGVGFSKESPDVLKDALERHAQTRDVVAITQTEFGTKYTLECSLLTPDGSNVCVMTIWIADKAEDPEEIKIPRLVTLIPGRRPRRKIVITV